MATSSSKPTSTAKAAAKTATPKTGKTSTAKSKGKIDLLQPLQEYFGLDSFRGDQEEIIQTLLSGTDTFVIMPTGGGKSLCYQLPAMISEGVAIIVSPLIALMKNQVDLVRSYSTNDAVAHFLNSTLNKKEIKEVHDDLKSGKTKMLVCSARNTYQGRQPFFFQRSHHFFLCRG